MRTAPKRLTASIAAGLVAVAGAVVSLDLRAQEGQEGEVEATVELAPKNASGIRGTATIRDAEEEATEEDEYEEEAWEEEEHEHEAHGHVLVVELGGLDAGRTYPVHIHRGTCADGGPVLVGLDGVTATASGRGTSTTAVTSDALAELEEESEAYEHEEEAYEHEEEEHEGAEEGHEHPDLFVQAHSPDGTPVACGDVHMNEEHEES